MRRRVKSSFAVILALPGFAACSTGTQPSGALPVGDPQYVFNTIAASADSAKNVFVASKLSEALPNQTYILRTEQGVQTFKPSVGVVVGPITGVSRGEARMHTDEDEYEIVDFDDPRADERTALITVEVEEGFGFYSSGQQLVVRTGLHGAENPDSFVEGLRALGSVVIVLGQVADGPDKGTLYPAQMGTLLGQVSSEGRMTFPALEEDGANFLGGIRSVGDMREALAVSPPALRVLP